VEDSTVQQPKQNQAFLDKFFISVTASGLLGGTISTVFFSSLSLVPIVPAIFFGLGISSLVYHFMGGIKPDTKIKIGAVTLTGTLGSLVATIWILNLVINAQIEQQMRNYKAMSLLFSPEENSLLVLKKETGEAVKVSVDLNGIPMRIGKTITVPERSVLDRLKELCRRGDGFCREPDLLVNFKEDPLLSKGQAKVCGSQFKFNRYPFLIKSDDANKEAVLVKVIDNDILCPNKSGQLSLKISSSDARSIFGKKAIGKGTATLAPLIDLPLTPSGNIAQKNSSSSPKNYSFVNNYYEAAKP
jgi:hypothetical protein